MYPISAAFAQRITASHTVATNVTVCDAVGNILATLNVTDGDVRADKRNAIRRTCSVTLTDPTGAYTPADITDLLAPNGNELRVYRGAKLANGTTELVPLGVFGIEQVEIDDNGERLTIKVEGSDRAAKLQRARFTDVYTIASGTNYATAIQTLLNSRVTGLTYSFMTTALTTPSIVVAEQQDPWKQAQDLAANIGAELYFDVTGVVVLRPEPNPSTSPVVWTYTDGHDAMILAVNRVLQRTNVYNHFVVTGEGTGVATPVRAESKDTDPSSPTYYLGPFGDVPRFYSSPLITTTAQAQSVADAFLNRVRGLVEDVRFPSLVNPAHEPGDVVTITRARAGVSGTFLIDSLEIPLAARSPMNATTRTR